MVSIASTNVNVNNINNHKYATNFRGNTTNKLERTPTTDKLDITTDNKTEKKNSHKALFATAGILGTLATVALLIKKNRYSEVKELASNIEFKRANTVEEAIEFGKKNFGIKSYEGFEAKDIDIINWFNEGITNVSNKHNGKLRIPKNILYTTELGEDTLAGVISDKNCKYFGLFCINKKMFNNIDKDIRQYIKDFKPVINIKSDNQCDFYSIFNNDTITTILKHNQNFDNGNASFDEKIMLYQTLKNLKKEINAIKNGPLIKIKEILKNTKYKDILNKKRFDTNIENIKKLNKDDQYQLLFDYIINTNETIKLKNVDRFQTIYHEMGHLQDNVPRVNAIEKFKTPEEYPKELKEWLNNENYMQVASNISDYSCSGPGEFIAETYAELISGNKLPEDVIKLYKELKGPSIPGII